jgi:hypothetical protein
VDPFTQLLTLLLTSMSSILPGATQNQAKLQRQTSQRQLSASDFANNPSAFIARLGNLLGFPGANPNAAGGGVGGITGATNTAIKGATQQGSQALTNNVWQQEQPQLAAAGMSQAPGIANEEMATALAPFQIQEQQLGAQTGMGEVQNALSTESSNLQFPFNIGSGAAGSFPSFSAL